MPTPHKLNGVAALLMCCSTTYVSALPSGDEHHRLALIDRQLEAVVSFSLSTEAPVPDPNDRYRFDYDRLSVDLELIRQGIDSYLTPSRAQPRSPPELTGHYTRSTQDQP